MVSSSVTVLKLARLSRTSRKLVAPCLCALFIFIWPCVYWEQSTWTVSVVRHALDAGCWGLMWIFPCGRVSEISSLPCSLRASDLCCVMHVCVCVCDLVFCCCNREPGISNIRCCIVLSVASNGSHWAYSVSPSKTCTWLFSASLLTEATLCDIWKWPEILG